MTQTQEYRSTSVPFEQLTPVEQIVEIFYKRAVELVKCAYQAINRAYPLEARRESPKIDGRYAEAHRLAKQHLNYVKKDVAAFVPVFCKVRSHKAAYDATQDLSTTQFRNYINSKFGVLYDKLMEYADMLLPEEDVPTFLSSLAKVFTNEQDYLINGGVGIGVANYEIEPTVKAEDFIERFGTLVSIHRRTRKPNAEVYGEVMPHSDQRVPVKK